VALFAKKHGQQIGKNIVRSLFEQRLRPFRGSVIGQGISIGNRTAVGTLKGIPMKGKMAWISWRSVVWGYAVPTWDRRLRLLADWLIWPFVGRDIVQMGPSENVAYDVRHHVYQPGEAIAESARPTQLVHIIVEGNVEIYRGRDGSEELVETIGAGDHFGRKWLERRSADAARAKSLVRTLTLHEDQANQLQDVLLSTERIVARTSILPTIDVEALKRGEDS
jgi:hypothetical protein